MEHKNNRYGVTHEQDNNDVAVKTSVKGSLHFFLSFKVFFTLFM